MGYTGAFWLNNEKAIRIVFWGSPFWLVYNLVNCV